MGPLDRLWIRRALAACEVALLCDGGEELLDDARSEAAWYADMYHPWDGVGPEPAARVNAWFSILAARSRSAPTGVAVRDRGWRAMDERARRH